MAKPQRFALLVLMAFIWTASATFVIDWSAEKIVLVFFFASSLLRGFLPRERRLPLLANYGLLLTYVLAISIYGALHAPDSGLAEIVLSNIQRPPIRMYVRTVFWILQTFMVFIGFKGIEEPGDFARLLRIFLSSALVVVCVAVLQILAFYLSPSLSRVLTFFSAGEFGDRSSLLSFRPSPFVWEPRYFGLAMGVVLASLILIKMFPISDIPRIFRSRLLMMVVSLLTLMTASTSAVGGVALGIAFLGAWLYSQLTPQALRNRFSRFHSSKSVRANSSGLSSLVGLFLLIAIAFALLVSTSTLFVERLDSYLQISGLGTVNQLRVSDVESGSMMWNAYIRWLKSEPLYLLCGAGLGSGSFQAFRYVLVPGVSDAGHDGLGLSARLPLLDTLGDIGLIGTFLMLSLLFGWWRRLGSLRPHLTAREYAPLGICRGLVLFFLGCWCMLPILPLAWLFLGLAYSYAYALAEKKPELLDLLVNRRSLTRYPARCRPVGQYMPHSSSTKPL